MKLQNSKLFSKNRKIIDLQASAHKNQNSMTAE